VTLADRLARLKQDAEQTAREGGTVVFSASTGVVAALAEVAEVAKQLCNSDEVGQTDAIRNPWSQGPVIYVEPGNYFSLTGALASLEAELEKAET
jgi:hypothetical protein